ncbi:hypothetical protein NHF39_23675 [Pseudomonas proteolytica]|nr:hypothetical protein [Pseudomonas proteolytica]USW94292.1 hypothetical protein NHF39_23675 [Pseudomonas proteolytica]USX01739.1 hypothetical protein NHF41_07905 [Pseudomonas proteolytica]
MLLYRPLYATSLQQYANRAALFEAIAQPGPLQTSVLTWLPDSARPIYDHGGFREPHYLRFGLGSEFAPIRTPPPATLGYAGLNEELQQCLVTGRLMQYLFSEHSRALVDQAERESTSNHESRWQVLMEGASLLFGSLLLPTLRGPAMLVGWLLAMNASFTQAIQTIASDDTSAKEQATIDLLLNVAMLLLDFPPAKAWSVPDPLLRQQALGAALRRRESDPWPVPPAAQVRQGTVGLPGSWRAVTTPRWISASPRPVIALPPTNCHACNRSKLPTRPNCPRRNRVDHAKACIRSRTAGTPWSMAICTGSAWMRTPTW